MDEVNVFRYLGVDLSANRSMKDEVNPRIDEWEKVGGVLRHLWRKVYLWRKKKK